MPRTFSSHLAYHYGNRDGLLKAFRSVFQSRDNPFTKGAAMSLGNSLSASRFYFADAAAQRYIRITVPDLREVLNEQVAGLNLALTGLVESYALVRGKAMGVDPYL